MSDDIPAAEANRSFSRVLREVRENQATFVITSHGKPVARLSPAASGDGRTAGRNALIARLRAQPVQDVGPWTRDELYQR